MLTLSGEHVMMRRFLPMVFCLLLAAPGATLAHETWLLPSVFASPPGRQVSFDLTSGMGFPESDRGGAVMRRLDSSQC